MPDDQFIDRNSGVNVNVSSAFLYYPDSSELATLKYFPDSLAKNRYSFPLTPNTIYQAGVNQQPPMHQLRMSPLRPFFG